MRNAAEISVVYDDGTVVRLEGSRAIMADTILRSVTEGGDLTRVWNVTKPFRKVTEVEGQLVLSWYDTEASIQIGPETRAHGINECLFPREVVRSLTREERKNVHQMVYPENRAGPRCKFRIVIEAILVETENK